MRRKHSLPVWMVLGLAVLLAACEPATQTLSAPELAAPSQSGGRLSAEEEAPKERISTITPSFGGAIAEQKNRNRDVVGWLQVPGTDVDTAIVQNKQGDNGFYTNHDADGNPDENGTYFADTRCDFTSGARSQIPRNIALYAHNFTEDPDGEFFAQLKRFKDPAFARDHPYLLFSTAQADMVWEIFAVYDTTVDFPYILPDLPWEVFQEVLQYVSEASIYDYGITVEEGDKVLTLSTCSFVVPGRLPLPHVIGDYRFVVMARLVDPGEEIKHEAAILANDHPLPPDAMPMLLHPYLDILQYDGQVFAHRGGGAADGPENDIDASSLVPVGEIGRSGVFKDLQDFDATTLAVGTKLFRHNSRHNILVAEQAGGLQVYTAPYDIARPDRIKISLLDESGATAAEKEITDKQLLEQYREILLRARRLRTTDKELERTAGRPEVRITAYSQEAQGPGETALRVFPAIPMFLQREAAVIQDEAGYRYLADEDAQALWQILGP